MLEKLEIKETRDTPEVVFDPENNIFIISGNSLPEDTTEFFTPLFNWLTDYKKNPNDITKLVCELEYFNSSSAKMLYEIFFELEKITENGKQVSIEWIYEKDDKLIEEKGLEYQSVLSIPFEMIEK
jgi:hypothetical protein